MKVERIGAAIDAFYQVSKQHADQVLGEFEKRARPLPLPALPGICLPPELAYYYAHYHCDAIFRNPGLAITPVEKLVRRQEGFATGSTDQGKTMQPDPAWNEHWTVFADLHDDPIVADASTPGAPVYAAIEGVSYKLLAPSLADFFRVLAKAMEVTAALKSQQPTSDDTEEWIAFGAGVEAPATLAALRKFLADQYVEAINHFFYS